MMFVIVANYNKFWSTGKSLNKMKQIYIVEYYQSIKKKNKYHTLTHIYGI